MYNNLSSYKKLVLSNKKIDLKKQFEDGTRSNNWFINCDNFCFDYSRNLLDSEQLQLLMQFAQELELKEKFKALSSGALCNFTEKRAALHTALRSFDHSPILVNERDVIPEIIQQRKKIELLCQKVKNNELKGSSGKRINTIVNIGIGGSFLGSLMSNHALKDFSQNKVQIRFIAELDQPSFDDVLHSIDPETTLFIINSKSFTTGETLFNTQEVISFLQSKLKQKDDFKKHLIAITAAKEKALDLGIDEEKIFLIWDWIGGRFSISSATNLSLALYIGFDHYQSFLKGFNQIDNLCLEAPPEKDVALIMALIHFWYVHFLNSQSHVILPYASRLEYLPHYLQQLHMESLGKSIKSNNSLANEAIADVLWGGQGILSQHSFYQLLHQGTLLIPADFIGYSQYSGSKERHEKHMAHFFAQQLALAFGHSDAEREKRSIHEIIQGNRPHNALLFDSLTPFSLGQLIALYEHKTIYLSFLFDINPFDQYGVELGKTISNQMASLMQNTAENDLQEYTAIKTLFDRFTGKK